MYIVIDSPGLVVDIRRDQSPCGDPRDVHPCCQPGSGQHEAIPRHGGLIHRVPDQGGAGAQDRGLEVEARHRGAHQPHGSQTQHLAHVQEIFSCFLISRSMSCVVVNFPPLQFPPVAPRRTVMTHIHCDFISRLLDRLGHKAMGLNWIQFSPG